MVDRKSKVSNNPKANLQKNIDSERLIPTKQL